MSIGKTMKYTFWGWKGNYLSHKFRFEKAIKIYNEMIEMDPTKTRPYRDKLYCLLAYNRYGESLECIDALLAIEPDNAEHHFVKGSILSSKELKRYEEAISYYDQAIALKQDYDAAFLEKGIALMNLDKDDEAIQCLNQAISLAPDKAYWAYCHKAIIMNKKGKYQPAITLCDTALATDMGKNFNKDLANSIKEKALTLEKEHGEKE